MVEDVCFTGIHGLEPQENSSKQAPCSLLCICQATTKMDNRWDIECMYTTEVECIQTFALSKLLHHVPNVHPKFTPGLPAWMRST